ncbi:MAG: DNA repair protein RadA [Fusobacteriaceae bacterium]|nr:DNA repair protein RadA [Fusobacteriaceae bacterium]
MGKKTTVYVCANCGYASAKWLGKCPQCNEWGTFEEETAAVRKSDGGAAKRNAAAVETAVFDYADVSEDTNDRYRTSIGEFDRLLGGGLLKGEVILLTGNPGIGKSTLLLQAAQEYGKIGPVLYISGEESPAQIKNRGARLGVTGKNLKLMNETDMGLISDYISRHKPVVVVVDSIQTVYDPELEASPGSPTQIRECALRIIDLAKKQGVSFFIVGHITKDGKVAGPKMLEHMVDAVFNFEGEEGLFYRILRSTKNRFGSTNEIAVFSMEEKGMREVKNAAEYFLSEREEKNIGSMVVPVLEGSRTFLLEVQSLVTDAVTGFPRRIVNGFDRNRIQILVAVADKMLELGLVMSDLFLNIPGGIEIRDPAADLGVVISLLSRCRGVAISQKIAAVGELGLRGEVRKAFFLDKRLRELEKLGFTGVYVPEANRKEIEKNTYKLRLIYLKNIEALLEGIKKDD